MSEVPLCGVSQVQSGGAAEGVRIRGELGTRGITLRDPRPRLSPRIRLVQQGGGWPTRNSKPKTRKPKPET